MTEMEELSNVFVQMTGLCEVDPKVIDPLKNIRIYIVTKKDFKTNFGEYVQCEFLFDKDIATLGMSILYSDIGFIFVDNIVKCVMMFLPKHDIVEVELLCALIHKINKVVIHELIHLCHYLVTDEQIYTLDSIIFSYATTLDEYIV